MVNSCSPADTIYAHSWHMLQGTKSRAYLISLDVDRSEKGIYLPVDRRLDFYRIKRLQAVVDSSGLKEKQEHTKTFSGCRARAN